MNTKKMKPRVSISWKFLNTINTISISDKEHEEAARRGEKHLGGKVM